MLGVAAKASRVSADSSAADLAVELTAGTQVTDVLLALHVVVEEACTLSVRLAYIAASVVTSAPCYASSFSQKLEDAIVAFALGQAPVLIAAA